MSWQLKIQEMYIRR